MEGIVSVFAPPAHRHLEQLELPRQRADTEAEHEPAVGEPVEGAVPLGHLQRVVVREHEDVGGEPDLLGVPGQTSERGQRIPVDGAPHLRVGRRHGHVLAARQVVEAQPVGRRAIWTISSIPAEASHAACAPGICVATGVITPNRTPCRTSCPTTTGR